MRTERLEVRVANLDCDSDAARIRRNLEGFRGLVETSVNPGAAKVTLVYDPDATSPAALRDKLDDLGFPVQAGGVPPGQPRPWRNPKVLTSAVSGVLALAAWLVSLAAGESPLFWGLAVAAVLIGGYYFGREALEELVFERRVTIMLLMAVAAVVATAMGEPLEGAVLVFLYSISEAAEGYTEEKTRSAVRALMDLAPKTATVRRDGRDVELPVEEIAPGDVFLVRPGQGVPTDGEVVQGASGVNQAPVTGESMLVEKAVGDTVFAGSINGEGALEVRATRAFADNTISRIIQMVEAAHERKGTSHRWIERFGARYSPAVLLVGLLIATVPPLAFGAGWTEWITRATVFIVAAAPCALVISVPITLVSTLGTGARHGVLIKGGVYVEELAKVKVVALDKTGTVTKGEPDVTDVVVLKEGAASDARRVLAIAAGVERQSQHPLALAIVRHAAAQGIDPAPVEGFRSLTGAGATAEVEGRPVFVGSPDLFSRQLGIGVAGAEARIEELQASGKTVVLVGDQTGPWALVAIRDNLRENAARAIAALHRVGVERVVMLTGDNERTARAIAREAGIDEVHADLKPEDKAVRVRELTRTVGHVAMVGDGVNDAPALAEATVGVAMGAAGTDVALETADVALMADDLEKLVYALTLARRNQAIVRQNLVLSAVVIGALVIGAVTGAFTLPIAVLGHEISEFVVIGNGLRMLRS
jgi:heavy metal translocating P-type ATPase